MATPPTPLVRSSAAEAIVAVLAAGGAADVPAPLVWDPARHLMSRFAYGPVGATGPGDPDAWFAAQVALGTRNKGYRALPALARRYPYLALTPAQTRAALLAEGNEYGWSSMTTLDHATLALQAWSPAQLYENVVDVFSNRLNVANYTDSVWANRLSYDRDVIRANAFGTYTTMLLAAMKHPAMLSYLNNDQSTWDAPNENLGRELLELHTVGPGAGYTQADVVNSARILTGRGVDSRTSDYAWSQGEHWLGRVRVLGFTHANAKAGTGEAVGDLYLRYLAAHPATASRLALTLCTRFVSDTPSADLVAAVAAAYTANNTAIVPMVQTIFRSTEFWASRGAKTRRPLENIVATVRALGLVATDLDQAAGVLSWMSSAVGQQPLAWTPPNGYPDVAAAWRSSGSLLDLWSNHLGLASNWWPKYFRKATTATFYGTASPATVSDALDAAARQLLGTPLVDPQRQAMLDYLGEAPTTPLASSSLTWELGNVAALLLHSPLHALR